MKGWGLAGGALLGAILLSAPGANADTCSGGGAGDDAILIDITCSSPGGSSPGNDPGTQPGNQPAPFVRYQWASVCTTDPEVNPNDVSCAAALTCPDPAQTRWQLWGQVAAGGWRTLGTRCFGGVPPAFVPPQVTAAVVLNALRRIGLPELETHTQPEAKTLVNFDTIFYARPRTVDLQLTLLGQAVRVQARPTSYRWAFGDGTAAVTRTPGDPYPRKTVVHRYQHAHVVVGPRVAVTYTARFKVGDGAWQDISETVTTTGPTTALRVAEATALLSGNHG